MDLKDVKRSQAEEMNSTNKIKSCSGCHTTRTPLWRSGPAGPKSMCNACGIKYNKRRRQLLGIDNGKKKKKISEVKNSKEIGQSLKMKLMALGGKLREEEQAAILLMALSCGSVKKLLF
ncbi:GATA transcription factor 16-like [Lycium ferocissimum]|uniref:GATA transcription factor 16-like n=1 Tax=Lycium ferocissimum TaxID=112874 RepID=UPI002814C8E0|nr:GATA transcription factor 16-like [Lycium ferocissimum]